jgi:hypothetical protein
LETFNLAEERKNRKLWFCRQRTAYLAGLPDGTFLNKNLNFDIFLGLCNGKFRYILWSLGIFKAV